MNTQSRASAAGKRLLLVRVSATHSPMSTSSCHQHTRRSADYGAPSEGGRQSLPLPWCTLGAHNSIHASQRAPSLMEQVVVFGGSGFVGQSVCQAALALGCDVVSFSRSGSPEQAPSWASDVQWLKGDIFKPEDYAAELVGATGVVTCVGAFGTDEFMERVCGDANVAAAEAAAAARVPHFVFVSAAGAARAHLLLRGYYAGKAKAEAAVARLYPDTGVCLRPGAIYGDRVVRGVRVPLGAVFAPLERVLSLGGPFAALRDSPFEAAFTPPADVRAVGRAAALAALGRADRALLSVEDINRLAADATA
ncbi:hypothetical protein JKP88DRAFT_353692 [Tribonema minus]|uniref:NAD(P)-binding domain-containing protein n=1 Tax=Tribonema minus TaxID=303371 RepID=A0A835ZEQ4_9STRA|nr:hypothetical protein JKP88DRAFT_353692 [Tribonema minus]